METPIEMLFTYSCCVPVLLAKGPWGLQPRTISPAAELKMSIMPKRELVSGSPPGQSLYPSARAHLHALCADCH